MNNLRANLTENLAGRFWPVAVAVAGLLGAVLVSGAGRVESPGPNIGKQLLRDYAGNDNWSGLLKDPKVWPQIQKLLGPQLHHLEQNLDVSGAVDVVGGDLNINGNAPHQGTEEEAAVCVNTYNLEASAAIYSKGSITIFSRANSYDGVSRCIKDWITLVNTQHRDRMSQPKNVRLAGGK